MPVLVRAPSRLHLGMFSFGWPGVRQYGGVGLMVNAPSTVLEITPGRQFEVSGREADRALQYAHRLIDSGLLGELPACRIQIRETPPSHIGLGAGTQLALAVARGLLAFASVPSPPAIELARHLGRGRRSAVGSYGFEYGGLIVEAGKHPNPLVPRLPPGNAPPLVARVNLPADWRFLLVMPRNEQGLSGPDEESAFAQLPPVPQETTAQLCREVLLELLPAAQTGDFDRFAESMYRFGRLAGTCFSSAQYGAFASRAVQTRIESLRAIGIRGAAQTSWGPTVLAVLPNEEQAKSAASQLADGTDSIECDIIITAPNNRGASVEHAQ